MEIVIEDEAPVQKSAPSNPNSPSIVIEDDVDVSGTDMRSALALSKTPPEEAAQNINRSKIFQVSPDSYKANKDNLEPDAIAFEDVPDTIEPETKNYLSQSEQHASLASKDIDKMNAFERRAKYYGQKVFDIPERSREINEIISKKMDTIDGVIDPAEEAQLQSLNAELAEMNSSAEVYGIGDKEDFAVDVLSAGGDIIRSYWDNKELIAGTIGAGTLVGGGLGLATPIPGATVAGLVAGATKGAIAASAVVGLVDGYKQTSRSLYNELSNMTDDQGQPLNISHEKKNNVSRAVGAISGLAAGVAGKILASNNPFFKRFLSPKLAAKYVGKTPAMMAKLDILGGIAKTVFSEGSEEGFQEFIQLAGEKFGAMDDSESSFTNAIEAITETWEKNKGQVVRAAAVGAVSGGVVQTISSAPAYNGLKSKFEEMNYVTQRKTEVLEAQNNMIELAEDLKATKMNELSPSEMGNFTKRVFSSLGVDENVWMSMEDMRTFSNSPEKAAAIRKTIDPTGDLTKMAQELNTPLQIPKSDFLKIVTEFPEVSDYMRLTPDGENPLAIRNEGKEFAGRLDKAEQKRLALMEGLGLEGATPEQEASAMEDVRDSKYFNSRESYLDQAAIQPIEGIVNPKDAADLSEAQLNARLAIDASLTGKVDARFDKQEITEYKSETERDIQLELESLDKEFSVLESFNRRKDLSDVDTQVVSNHKKKGFSAFAIDPKSLPEDLKAIYLEHPEMKKRKVFVEGGIDIDESAVLNGLENGAELLRILAETPTKKQIETRTKSDPLREFKKRQEISAKTEGDRIVARDEAFSSLTKAHLKEMDYMTKKEWPTLKRGIIKIARKAPTIEALNIEAKDRINKMKIRDINPNAFKQGENRSQKAAVEHFVKGEFESAFDAKEKAALNNELRKESTKAQDKVERFQKFWKKASDPSFIQELKDANMFDVMEEFMSLYKLDGNIRGEVEQDSFKKWVTQQDQAGNFVPVVPQRLNNTQASYKDLTVEQYQTMTEMGQFIVHQAKLKNEFMANQEARAELRTAEMVAEKIDELTKANINYDPKRAERKNINSLSVTEGFAEGVRTSMSAVSSIKTVAFELDNYELDGFFHRTIDKPIKDARTNKRTEQSEIVAHDKEVMKTFYGDKFGEMYNFVSVPEFADIPSLGDGEGNIRKVDLLTLQAYMGDPSGREAMVNFVDRKGNPFTVESMIKVLDTHLTENDAAFVQNFMNDRFKRFKDRSFDLHKRTTGIEPDMVEGIPVVHKGKVLAGGYYPLKYRMADDSARAAKFLADLKSNMSETLGISDEGHFYAQMRTAEMTNQGRLKERTGSIRPLDINFENFINFTEEALHDIHFRETGMDVLKVLKNELNVTNMKSVVGPRKFAALLNGVKDVISKTTERESTLFGDEYQAFNNIINKAHSLHAMKTIGFNVASAAIQPSSLSNLLLRVGPMTGKYLFTTSAKMMANITKYEKYVALAAEINPDIKFEEDGIDNAIIKNSYDFIPASTSFFKKWKNTSGTAISRIRGLQKKVLDSSFYMVREADKFIKVLTTHALSEQFFNGDIPNFSLEKIQAMSENEKAVALRSIVQQSTDLSLTASATEDKSPLEKNKVAGIFTRYFTDRRSALNSVLAQVDKVSGSIRRKDNAKAVKQIMTLVLATGANAAFISAVRNEDESLFKRLAGNDDALDIAGDTAWDFIKAPVDQTLSNIPFIDNMKYQSELKSRSDYRNVGTPLTGVMSDLSAGYVILKNALDAAIDGHATDLSDVQRKILLTDLGYIAGGAPSNSLYKAYESLNSGAVKKGSNHLVDEIKGLHRAIDSFINIFQDKPEAKQFIEDLKEQKKELPQFDSDVKNILPENTKSTLKEVLSKGKWNAFDKETGAAGIYQFTEERWNDLKILNPDLGLTDNGRVAKDSSQQEKAMGWEIQDHTRGLLTFEVPVTEETLLGAHKFGLDNYIAIYGAKDTEKLSSLIGDEAKSPVFKGFESAGAVKFYLTREIKKTK
jgi:hypothetical protein